MPKGVREGGKPAAVLKAQRGAKKGTQKGRARHFTSPEELAAQAAQLDLEREGGDRVREPKADGESSTSESESSESESDSGDEVEKTKGVSALIEIENPNRVAVKNKKLSELTIDTTTNVAPQLSRREREEVEKESQKRLHEQLRAEGKTEQARADLARLAIIREEREQAAKRRAAEQKVKEAARATKVEATPSLKKDDPGAASTGKK